MPEVSVICAVKNGALYIREAILSVLNQSFTNFEVIVIDDGSTDETPDILKELQDHRLLVIRQTNKGVAAARNEGIRRAKADWIAFIDGDDIWMADKLEEQMKFLQQNPNIAMLGSWCRIIDAEGSYLYTEKKPATHEENIRALQHKNVFTPSSIVVRTDLVKRHQGFYEERFVCTFEDYILAYQLALHGEVYQLQQSLAQYRIIPSGASRMCQKIFQNPIVFEIVKRGYALPSETEILKRPQKTVSPNQKTAAYHLFLGRSFLFHRFDRSKALRHTLKSLVNNPFVMQIWVYLMMALFWPERMVSAFYKKFGPSYGYTFVEKEVI